MPFILVGDIRWDGKDYNLSIEELQDILPHIKENDMITFSILEIRNERNEVVKRFKPIQKIKMSLALDYTSHVIRMDRPPLSLKFSPYHATELNIGDNYKVAILILEVSGKPLFPFELRYGGYGAEEFAKSLEKIEANLFLITQPELQETVNYLLEASMFDKQGRIEDVRVYLRKAIETLMVIRSKIKVTPGKETEDFGRRLENLLKSIKSFVDYGGPHLGPAPKPTTDMVFSMVVDVVKMLSQNMAEGNITIGD